MQIIVESPRDSAGDTKEWPDHISEFPGRFRRNVDTGAMVYQPGEQRRLYRVENGAICHYFRPVSNGQHEVIEFAFPGDIIGLGSLPTHVTAARAMVETSVCIITDKDLERALTNDNRLFFRIAEACEREFDYLKNRSLNASRRSEIQRLANFLLAIVSTNASEGRESLIVTDDISSGYVAEQLQMSIDMLAKVLMQLKENGVIDVWDNCLRILDIAALEAMAANARIQSA